MFQLIKRIFLFSILLVLIKLSLDAFYKDELTYRREKLAEQDYNTVFIGSSRTKFAIVTHYFDTLANYRTKSYNFGLDGGLPPQTLAWGEEIVNNKPSVKYIFIELSGVDYVSNFIGFNLPDYQHGSTFFSLKELSGSSNKIATFFFRPQFQIGRSDFDLRYGSWIDKHGQNGRRETFQQELMRTKLRGLRVEKADDPGTENDEYWRKIENVLKAAESRNVRVYFFVPPRLLTDNEANTVSPMYHKIPEKYKIRAVHLDESLYTVETSRDEYHLNRAGAEIFTKAIAEAFADQSF
ncbi:MAG: hypothetical protein WBD22_06060 [Pyrinomonadaceae bacterium]